MERAADALALQPVLPGDYRQFLAVGLPTKFRATPANRPFTSSPAIDPFPTTLHSTQNANVAALKDTVTAPP